MAIALQQIHDRGYADNIQKLTRCIVSRLDPLRVYLFGSFADGSYTDESDYDFYIVVSDGSNVGDASDLAYKAVRFVQKRPVDIVVGTSSRFRRLSASPDSLQVEREVFKKGILLYDRDWFESERAV